MRLQVVARQCLGLIVRNHSSSARQSSLFSCVDEEKRLLDAVARLESDPRMSVQPMYVPIEDNVRASEILWEHGWVIVTGAGSGKYASETLPERFFAGTDVSLFADNRTSLIANEVSIIQNLTDYMQTWFKGRPDDQRCVTATEEPTKDAIRVVPAGLEWQQPLLLHTDAMYVEQMIIFVYPTQPNRT